MLVNKPPLWPQVIRFGAVGISNTAVDMAVFFLSVWLGMAYLPAQIMAYTLGAANSFWLNRYWTFQLRTRTRWAEICRFAVINGLSLSVSATIIFICHGLSGVDLWIAKIVATAGGIAINFVGSRVWVFAHQPVVSEYNNA
jgi:putative flippase GtrA